MRLVCLIILLLLPALACAEPVTTAIALWWSTAGVIQIASVALTIVTTAYSVYGAAQQRRQAAEQQEAMRNEYNAALRDKTLTRIATYAPHRLVFGRDVVGSDIVAMFTGGDRDQYKYLVCVHAAHECDAIEEIYLNKKALGTLDGNGGALNAYYAATSETAIESFAAANTITLANMPSSEVVISYLIDRQPFALVDSFISPAGVQTIDVAALTGNSGIVGELAALGVPLGASYHYETRTPRVWVRKHLGAASDPVDAWLQSEIGADKWPSTAVLRNKTYTIIKLDLNEPELQGGIPAVEVRLRGAKLYDYRTGLTAWSENNALVAYAYLTSGICGIDAADLPLAQWIAAANVCDEAIAGLGARYTFNGVITADEEPAQVIEKIAQSMGGRIVATTWDIFAGSYAAPVLDLFDTDIVGALAVTAGAPDADIYNGIKGQFTSAENNYVATDFAPYQNAAYRAEDGDDIFSAIDFPYTNTTQRIHNLCRIFTEDHRNGFSFSADFSLKAWGVKVGQRVRLTFPLFGQNAKIYRVTDKKYGVASPVNLTLKEDAPEIWDFADAVNVDATPNSNLKNPFVIEALTNVACSSGTDTLLLQRDKSIVPRILASWDAATSAAIFHNGEIEIEWRAYASGVWQKSKVSGDTTQAYLSPVNDGTIYFVRVRGRDPRNAAVSDWAYAGAHRVLGKELPPSDVPWAVLDGNRLTWGEVTDLDLAGYRWKYHYGDNDSWGDAHALHSGLVTESPWTPQTRPQGAITLMVKAVDTSGNESGAAAVIRTQLQDVIVANVVETVDFKAGGYAGTVSGGTVSGGNLAANSVADFYGAGGANFYGPYGTAQFYNDYFSELTYETNQFQPAAAVAGSTLTLNASLTGAAPSIEYRVSGAAAMFVALGTEEFFGDDAANFFEPDAVYAPWPGQIAAKNLYYQFRFGIAQGVTQGVLATCAAIIDMPDLLESFNDVVISASGTRLPITKVYAAILNVQVTLQDDGGTATMVEVADKNATLGPLLVCRNAAGAAVAGKIDARIQGY